MSSIDSSSSEAAAATTASTTTAEAAPPPPLSGLLVRPAAASDKARMVDIMLRAFSQADLRFRGIPIEDSDFTEDSSTRCVEELMQAGDADGKPSPYITWVAETQEDPRTVLGWIGCVAYDAIKAIRYLAVDPTVQGRSVGSTLLRHAKVQFKDSTLRLVTLSAYGQAWPLYIREGFDTFSVSSMLNGVPNAQAAAAAVAARPQLRGRPMQAGDIEACDALYHRICGEHRRNELTISLKGGLYQSYVAEEDGAIVAFTTSVWWSGCMVAVDVAALKAFYVYLAAQPNNNGDYDAELVVDPVVHPELTRWAIASGLKFKGQLNMMTVGPAPKIDYSKGILLCSYDGL